MHGRVLCSVSRRREARATADRVFSPPRQRAGTLVWSCYEAVVQQGKPHARDALERADPALLNRIGVR